MIERKRKLRVIQASLFLLGVLIIIFTYSEKNKPLKEIAGNYEVIGKIYCKLPGIGNTVLNKGTILTVDENHPLYEDIEFYYNEKILKKL